MSDDQAGVNDGVPDNEGTVGYLLSVVPSTIMNMGGGTGGSIPLVMTMPAPTTSK